MTQNVIEQLTEPRYLPADVHARIRALDAERYPDGVAHFAKGDVPLRMSHNAAIHLAKVLDSARRGQAEEDREYTLEVWIWDAAPGRDSIVARCASRPRASLEAHKHPELEIIG